MFIAQNPENNPRELMSDKLSVTLIEHDYPGRTPAMWNSAYERSGFPGQSVMLVGDTTNVTEILSAAKSDDRYLGGGAGVGFKDIVVHHLDELDPLAEAIGAVNLIAKTPEGNLRGYNTDGIGFRIGLEKVLAENGDNLRDKQVLILGAGGTGNAIALALAEAGAKLTILNRTTEKAEALAERANRFVGDTVAKAGSESDIPEAAAKSDVIINVSTKGASGRFQEFAALAPAQEGDSESNLKTSGEVLDTVQPKTIVCDVILGTEDTPTIRLAKERGLTTIDGIPMVVNQGVEAIWIVHGDMFEESGVSKEELHKLFSQLM